MRKVMMTPETVRRGADDLRSLARRVDALEPTLYVRHLLTGDNGEIPTATLERLQETFGDLRRELRALEKDLRKDAREFDRRAGIVEQDLRDAKCSFLDPPKKSDTIWGTIKNAGAKIWDWIRNYGLRAVKFIILDDVLTLAGHEYVYEGGRWIWREKPRNWAEIGLILLAWGIPIPGGRLIGKAGVAFGKAVVEVFQKGFAAALKALQKGDAHAAVEAIKAGLKRVLTSAKGLALTMEGLRLRAQQRLARAERQRAALKRLEEGLKAGADADLVATSLRASYATAAANLMTGNAFEAVLGIVGLKRITLAGRALVPSLQDKNYELFRSTLTTARQKMLMDRAAQGAQAWQSADKVLEGVRSLPETRDAVLAELAKHRNACSPVAYQELHELVWWLYSDSPTPPPNMNRTSLVDTSASTLFDALMDKHIAEQQQHL